MLVSDIGLELAIRLGDPVTNPNDDGGVFTEQEKLKYISRAYSKLTRLLKILMRDYQPNFNKTRRMDYFYFPAKMSTLTLWDDEHEVYVTEVEELYIHYTLKGDSTVHIAPASYMEPSRYLSNKYDANDTKSTSFIEGKFKYTVMSNVILGKPVLYMLPIPSEADGHYYQRAEVLYKPDVVKVDWNTYLPITSQYTDLLIDLAAIQGMQDIARADKAQLIERSIAQDWQILGQYGTYMKQTEGVKE